jgi:translation elongation factor EF-1alpha
MLNTSPQKCQSYVPWYDGPDLASALSTITRNGNKTSNRIFVVTQKYISNSRCIGVLRQGSLKVGDKLDSSFGKFTVHSIKCRGEYINRAIYGEEIELGFNPPAVGLSTKNPSLHPYGVLSPNIKPVKEIRAIVSVYRNHVRKGMRNGIITVIQIWGSKKILCKIEVEKMLEDSQQLYQRRMNANPPEKYYYSQYDCFRKTLDRGVLGLVKITPRAEDELMYAIPQSESADLSRFYITDSSLVVGLGVVLKCA